MVHAQISSRPRTSEVDTSHMRIPGLEAGNLALDRAGLVAMIDSCRAWCSRDMISSKLVSRICLKGSNRYRPSYGFGYETLVREVADSLHWRRFCHIPLDEAVPHPTTLSKLTHKYGPEVLQDLNQRLVRKACEHKVVRGRKLRVDTTVIQAPIAHPTDIGLLADAVRVITRTVKQLQAAGAAVRTVFRNRMRSVNGALRAVGRALRTRTGEAKVAVEQQTARVLRKRAQLRQTLQLAAQLMAQTKQRLRGITSIPDRVVQSVRSRGTTDLPREAQCQDRVWL